MILNDTEEADVIKEFLNMGMGRAAGVLHRLLGKHITIIPPEFIVARGKIILSREEKTVSYAIHQTFKGELSGFGVLLFEAGSGQRLGKLVAQHAGDENISEDELKDVVQEVGNNTINAIAGTVVNQIRNKVTFDPPQLKVGYYKDILFPTLDGCEKIVLGKTGFVVNDFNIDGSLILGFSSESYDLFIDIVKNLIKEVA